MPAFALRHEFFPLNPRQQWKLIFKRKMDQREE
jgi:hypothetical protein